MPRIELTRRFAEDVAEIQSARIESTIYSVLESLQLFGGLGSPLVPDSIKAEFGDEIRKVAINPFDLVYSFYPDDDLVRVEALVHQKRAR